MAEAFAKGRKPQNEQDTQEDAFVDSVVRAGTWAQTHSTQLAIMVGALAVIVLGFFYWRNYQQSVAERADLELATLRGATAANPEDMAVRVQTFVERFDGTAGADEGRILLARVRLDQAQPAQAIEVLNEVDAAANTPLGYAALTLIAVAHEQAGDLEAARDTWADIGQSAQFGFQRRQARAQQARILMQLGDLGAAETILSALVEESEDAGDPTETAEYRLQLGEVRASQG